MKMNRHWRCLVWRSQFRTASNSSGFSQLELLVTLVIIGTLSLILAPSWLGLMNSQALNNTQNTVLNAMRTARNQAESNRATWQTSFRNTPQGIQMAIHPADALPNQIAWSTLRSGVQIDSVNTTLFQSSGVYRIQFGHQGGINGQLGRIVLQAGDRPTKRCVFTSSLLGVLRTASNQECNRTP